MTIPEDSEQPNDGPGKKRRRMKWDATKLGHSISRMVDIINKNADKIREFDETITKVQIEETSIPYDFNVFVVHPDNTRTNVYRGDLLRIIEMIIQIIRVRKMMLAIAVASKKFGAAITLNSYGEGHWRRYMLTITKMSGMAISPPVACVNEKMSEKLTYGEVMRSITHMHKLYEDAQLAEAMSEIKGSTLH